MNLFDHINYMSLLPDVRAKIDGELAAIRAEGQEPLRDRIAALEGHLEAARQELAGAAAERDRLKQRLTNDGHWEVTCRVTPPTIREALETIQVAIPRGWKLTVAHLFRASLPAHFTKISCENGSETRMGIDSAVEWLSRERTSEPEQAADTTPSCVGMFAGLPHVRHGAGDDSAKLIRENLEPAAPPTITDLSIFHLESGDDPISGINTLADLVEDRIKAVEDRLAKLAAVSDSDAAAMRAWLDSDSTDPEHMAYGKRKAALSACCRKWLEEKP